MTNKRTFGELPRDLVEELADLKGSDAAADYVAGEEKKERDATALFMLEQARGQSCAVVARAVTGYVELAAAATGLNAADRVLLLGELTKTVFRVSADVAARGVRLW